MSFNRSNWAAQGAKESIRCSKARHLDRIPGNPRSKDWLRTQWAMIACRSWMLYTKLSCVSEAWILPAMVGVGRIGVEFPHPLNSR